MNRREQYEPLEKALGYEFQRIELLEQALTHRSYAASAGGQHYERLEFLGDAVLQLVVSTYLYQMFPDLPEGQLAKIRALLVSQPTLAALGRSLCLDRFLKVGKGEDMTGVRERHSILCDVVEAVYGAIYLDGGLSAVQPVILAHLPQWHKEQLPIVDAKTTLQEHFQQRTHKRPMYILAGEEGPPHNKLFTVEVWFEGELLGRGHGRSKKEAAQAAARAALARLHLI